MQYHPESILSEYGYRQVELFMKVGDYCENRISLSLLLTENEYKQYHIQLKGFIKKYVATKLADVGEVIHFAQAQQRQGRYVSLY